MRSLLGLVIAALSACGSTEQGHADAQLAGTGDARADSGSPGTVDNVPCQTHTRTVVNSDGAKQETDTRFAIVDVAPGDAPLIEACGYMVNANGVVTPGFVPIDPACPSGATCSASGTALPTPSTVCTWNRYGLFFDDKLYISCGTASRSYNAQGAMTSSTSGGYTTIRIHH